MQGKEFREGGSEAGRSSVCAVVQKTVKNRGEPRRQLPLVVDRPENELRPPAGKAKTLN
jgi:hypothetical protein